MEVNFKDARLRRRVSGRKELTKNTAPISLNKSKYECSTWRPLVILRSY